MKRELQLTADGSHTIYIPEMDEHYHSVHGAVQESQHVYIEAGLKKHKVDELVLFEVGFGTGLNAWLTLLETEISSKRVQYYSIEKYPLTEEEYSALNFVEKSNSDYKNLFHKLHSCDWGKLNPISPQFSLCKINGDLNSFDYDALPYFDLIYFDAFAPNKQSELWTLENYRALYEHSNKGAILVTYCAKGIVRRELKDVGFQVERIAGPPGKMEMIRAIKKV